jgi:hypothetical protein
MAEHAARINGASAASVNTEEEYENVVGPEAESDD